jgi:transposase-like protein
MGSGIHYSTEFKIEAVRRVVESSRTYSDVADELSMHKDTLRKWVREVNGVRNRFGGGYQAATGF